MWEYIEPMTSDEIYHHGIKKQKWGQRLYQNLDGSLTPLGRLRYGNKSNYNRVQAAKASIKKKKLQARTDAEVAKYRKKAQETYDKELKKRSESEKKEEPKKEEPKKETSSDVSNKTTEPQKQTKPKIKTMEQMTTEEIKAATDRMNAEKDFRNAQKNLNDAEKNSSRGKKFVDKLLDESLTGLAKGVGDAIESSARKYINRTLGEAIDKAFKDDQKKDDQKKDEQKKNNK